MSDFEDIARAVLTHCEAVIPGGANTTTDELVLDQIPSSSWPIVYPDDLLEETELEEWNQGTQRLVVRYMYARLEDATVEEQPRLTMQAHLDLIRDALHGDRNLGGLVDNLEVIERISPKMVKSQSIGLFTVQTRRGR